MFTEVRLDGYPLAVRVLEATTAGPPVVFANALGSAMTGWDPVVSRLQPGPRMICYDRAAIGASHPRPPERRMTTYRGYAAELVDLLDRLGLGQPVVLVGHSIGSLLVRVLAVQWPDRVAGMVHVDGTVPETLALDDLDGFDGDAPGSTWIDHPAGVAEVTAATTFPSVPGVVLVRSPGRYTHARVLDLDQRWSDGQQRLAELTGACRIDAVDAGHHLQTDTPDLVAIAVRAVVDAARQHRPRLRIRSSTSCRLTHPGSPDDTVSGSSRTRVPLVAAPTRPSRRTRTSRRRSVGAGWWPRWVRW